MPFSNADPKTPGLYVEIGQAIGRAIGRPVAPVWNLTYFGKHAVRTTLLAGKCDASIGLPQDKDFMGPKVIFSKPLLQVGYALVVPKSAAVASLDDLSGRRVAVQFATTPQSLLADRDDIRMVTFREPEEAMGSAGRGPGGRRVHLGTDCRLREQDALDNVVSHRTGDGPGLQWPAAIGFASGQTALRQEVDQVIDSVAGEIEALKIKYGLPTEGPIKLGQSETTPKIILAATDNQPAVPAAPFACRLPAGGARTGRQRPRTRRRSPPGKNSSTAPARTATVLTL